MACTGLAVKNVCSPKAFPRLIALAIVRFVILMDIRRLYLRRLGRICQRLAIVGKTGAIQPSVVFLAGILGTVRTDIIYATHHVCRAESIALIVIHALPHKSRICTILPDYHQGLLKDRIRFPLHPEIEGHIKCLFDILGFGLPGQPALKHAGYVLS